MKWRVRVTVTLESAASEGGDYTVYMQTEYRSPMSYFPSDTHAPNPVMRFYLQLCQRVMEFMGVRTLGDN